jgi:hypothetical protein
MRHGEQQYANNGQGRFHVETIARTVALGSTQVGILLPNFAEARAARLMVMTFVSGRGGLGSAGFLFSLFHLLDVLGWFFVEILFAALATEFDFLALVFEDEGLAHFAEFLVGDGAGFESVRFGRFLVGGKTGERRCQHRNCQCSGDSFDLHSFKNVS